jgi:hypothetical protein
MDARPADAERKRGCDPLLAGDPDAACPEAEARDLDAFALTGWPTATRRKEEEARTLLVRATEMTMMRVAPVLGVELVHTATLGRATEPCLNIPGNYT